MFKKILISTIILLSILTSVYANETKKTKSNTTMHNLEIRGVISVKKVYVRKKPDKKSKIVRTLWRNAKIVVIGSEGNWYKIKVNNIRNGYIPKNSVIFKDTFRKESKRGSYLIRKVNIDIKSLIQRFNLNMAESMYYEKEGIIPYFKFVNAKKTNNKLITEIIYMGKNSNGFSSPINQTNPFPDLIKSFMEVIFFKMMIVKADEYVINIKVYDFSNKKQKYKNYATLTYDTKMSKFEDLKNNSGKIWKYIKSSVPADELFIKYP